MKMMPGQKPYTLEEANRLQEMLSAACDAEDEIDLDELERYADEQREKEKEDK
jgi:hypothetical protein